MENNEMLRQLTNTVEIIGTLKSKDIEVKTSKRTGAEYVSGKLEVICKIGNRIHEIPVSVFVMKSSKLYKGIETVSQQYKSIEEVGLENADRIRVTGELTLNEYYNRDGKLVQFNDVKGIFYNRIEDVTIEDKAVASIETVVEEFQDKMDSTNLPTGIKKVKGFTVGWNNSIVELVKAEVKADLADAMINLYPPGSTGRLSFQINNYVEIQETVTSDAPAHGFGSTETVEQVAKKYENNLEIIGGDIPFFGTKEYTPEEIEKAKQVRELSLQKLSEPAPSTPQTNTGFGNSTPQSTVPPTTPAAQSVPPTVNDTPATPLVASGNEMPDF